jgi:hypothetical protein
MSAALKSADSRPNRRDDRQKRKSVSPATLDASRCSGQVAIDSWRTLRSGSAWLSRVELGAIRRIRFHSVDCRIVETAGSARNFLLAGAHSLAVLGSFS